MKETYKETWTFDEMLAYHIEETGKWKGFFTGNAAALDLAADIAGGKTVRQVLLHITFVELRYAEGVNGMTISPIPDREKAYTVEELYAFSDSATQLFQKALASHDEAAWRVTDDFSRYRPGFMVSRRKMFLQAMTHSMRHYAQLATYLRQAGHKTDWMHDLLVSMTLE